MEESSNLKNSSNSAGNAASDVNIRVKKVRRSVIVMQRRFCVYVCARITRQRVRERERA